MLSKQSFNALLKSIEEPPPHVVFMMATTELHKIPATIRSRSQEFELRTIGARSDRRPARRIAEAEGIQVDDAALLLLARAGRGQHARRAERLRSGDCLCRRDDQRRRRRAVLGLVGRDVLMDMADVVDARRRRRSMLAAGRSSPGRT